MTPTYTTGGSKIGPLWLRMLRDNVGIEKLKNLDLVPIPVDVHVARSTFSLGIVKGLYSGSIERAFENVREAWFESVKDLRLLNREMIALDVDEPLWHLSKYGCTKRDLRTGKCPLLHQCEMRNYCVPGKVIVNSKLVEVDT